MVFERKKIQIETLGEYLMAVRNKLGLSIQEVGDKTGITSKILKNLETGQLKILPADVYVFGFLRKLGTLYAVNADELIKQYQKEQVIQRQLNKPTGWLRSANYQSFFSKLVITPKFLSLVLGILFVGLTVAYIFWQVWSINKTPSLQLFAPANNSVVLGASLQVNGRTDPGSTVTVNDQNVFVDEKGGFNVQVGLGPGPKQITVTSASRFGKSTSQTLNIVSQAVSPTASSSTLTLKIDFKSPVTLSVITDGGSSQSMNFSAGDTKTFVASQEITLSTTDAGATVLTLNGQALGPMGKSREPLNNVEFTSQRFKQ